MTISVDLNNDQKESTDFHDFTSHSIFSNPTKEYLYGFFGHIFKKKYSLDTKFKNQILYEIVINVILILQLSTLSWHPSLTPSDWNSYQGFWKSFSYINYDEICTTFELTDFCFYGTISLIGACLWFFITFGIFMYLEKDIPMILALLPRKIALLLTSVCIIPSTIILTMVIKYSLEEKSVIEEYSGNFSPETYDYGILGIIAGICSLLALIFINLFCEAFSCDMRHSHFKKNLKARSSAEYDLIRRWFYMIISILYVYIGNNNAWIYQIIFFLFCFYLCIRSMQFLQYFNVIENCIHACKLSSVSCTLLILIFGELIDNALIIVWLHLFFLPFVIYLTVRITRRNYEKMPDIKKPILTQFDFEQKYRNLFVDDGLENKEQVIELFKTFWSMPGFHKDKLFVIWEFNFCCFIIRDERLARIKLTKIGESKSSFEGDIQEWRLFDWLFRKHKSSFIDLDHLEYLKEFSKIKKHDEELCMILNELHAEFTSRNPRVNKLTHFSNRIARHIQSLSNGYKDLIEKYKNMEAFEYYATFLDSIMNDHDEADFIVRKKNSLNFFSQRNDEGSLENYGKDLPTILASCSNESFGTIVYINDKASQLLMSSMGNIIGSSILNFIPQPYSSRHEKLMKDFVFNCNSIEVPFHDSLFFLQNNGYLLECDFLIKLTAFHNCAYFLLSFKESAKKRQIALISEENAILAHTERFSSYFGLEGENIKGALVSDLIPIADICTVREYEPLRISFKNRELIIIHIAKEIKTKVVHIIAIIDDISEIQNWKSGKSQIFSREAGFFSSDDTEKEQISREAFEVKFNSIDYLVPTKSFENPDTTIFTHSRDSQMPDQALERRTFIDKVSDSESRSKGGTAQTHHQAKKLLMDSKRKIRILHLVLFAVMTSVIITVAAILVYMEIDVSYTSTLGSFQTFGQLVYDFELSADLSLTINALMLYRGFKEEINAEVEKMKVLIDDWEKIKGSIFKDFDQWSYCSYSKVVSEPSMLIWSLNQKTPQNSKENLYDTIATYIYNAKKLISAVDEGFDQLPYAKFLYINGLGEIFHDANTIMNGLASCEIERVKATGTNINVLLVSGFCTLGILILVIISCIMLVSKKLDEFWNYILNSGQWAMFRLKCLAMDRLATTHGADCKADTNPESQRNVYHTRKVKGTLYLQYIWRIMLFFVVAASYYLLIFNYLYPTLDQMMITRPSLLNNFIIRRALYLRLSLFSRDRVVNYTYYVIPEFYNYRQSFAEENLIINHIKALTKDLQTKKYQELLSDELKEKMYEKNNLAYKILDYGSTAALQSMIGDIVDIGYVRGETNAYFLRFIDKMKAVNNEIRDEFILADRDSINIINRQLDTIVDITIIYALGLCALFFFYYFPYLNLQIKQLQRFAILPTILPKDLD
ncbi:unnamed protein product [Blepharisma stoltei]|uniref:TmcB/TmcC TPR repeats domain-containing protein n=1 Tax=Blepharisma stoltei TaxID=1481888 RepID=A0AAU9J8Q5_9CILI|nr:unnamed protein product [Blepharisma stoltei]